MLAVKKTKLIASPRWNSQVLENFAASNLKKLRTHRKNAAENSPWWSFIHTAEQNLPNQITNFIAGNYKFEPMVTYHMPDETMLVWQYADRLIVRLLLQIIKPVFQYIISDKCFHLKGPNGVKEAISWVEKGLSLDSYRYFLRIDIKSYYASIDREILTKQISSTFNDPRLINYLSDTVNIPVLNDAAITLPSTGIGRRNSLSPFYGALYLSPVDKYFEKIKGIFYVRYMDDFVILTKTKKQFCRAKKQLKKILNSLKLKYSRKKTKMGILTKGFHFLGINFKISAPAKAEQKQAVTQIHPEKTNVSVSLHPRSAQRALDKLSQMREDCEINAHEAQSYLSKWARWWSKTSPLILRKDCLLLWIEKARACQPDLAWLGSGLYHFCYHHSFNE